MANWSKNKNIKNRLKMYRGWANITQQELADKIKVSVNLIRDIELRNKYPKYQIRARLLKVFNLSLEQLFYVEEDK